MIVCFGKQLIQSPPRDSTDVSPWRDPLSGAGAPGASVANPRFGDRRSPRRTHDPDTGHECAPTPAMGRSHGRKSVELQPVIDGKERIDSRRVIHGQRFIDNEFASMFPCFSCLSSAIPSALVQITRPASFIIRINL